MWYAKIENNEVVKIREFDGPDAVLEPKLLAHGYRIGEDGDSSYDPATQVRSTIPDYDIQPAKVVRSYFVADKTSLTDYGKVIGDEVTDVQVVGIEVTDVQKDVFEPTVIATLLADGYRPIEDGDSSYDPITQTRASEPSYDIQAEKIVRTYAVTDKSLVDGQTAKKEIIINSVDALLDKKFRDYRTYADIKLAEIDKAITLAEVRLIEADLTFINDTINTVRNIFENSILWDVDYSQVDTYIDKNVTDLTEAKVYLKKLSQIILAILKFNGLVK